MTHKRLKSFRLTSSLSASLLSGPLHSPVASVGSEDPITSLSVIGAISLSSDYIGEDDVNGGLDLSD